MQMVTRFGRSVPADAVFVAWTGGEINAMLAALAVPTNAVERHHLLSAIVSHFYRARATTKGAAQKLRTYAQMHLREMPELLSELERDWREGRIARGSHDGMEYVQPVVATFDSLCMLLCELGEYDAALDVWRKAAEVGYSDIEALDYHAKLIEKRRKRFAKAPPVVL